MTDQEKVAKMLYELKVYCKIPMSQVEKEIVVGAGYLWKVKDPAYKWPITAEKMKALELYHKENMAKGFSKKKVVTKEKKAPVAKKKPAAVKVVTPVIIKTPAQVPVKIVSKKPQLSAYMLSRQKLKSTKSKSDE